MHKITLTTLLLVFCSHAMMADIASRKTYRLVPVSASTKSLFTQNSSLDQDADVVMWDETDVPAQQWTVTGTIPSSVSFRNVYSQLILGTTTTRAGGTTIQINPGGTGGRWLLEAVNESANIYKLKLKSTKYYLTVISTDDNATPQLAEATDAETQQWKLVEVEPKSAFTAQMREEMMDAYIKSSVESRENNRKTFGDGGWGESEQLEVVLDAYETTGRADYLKLAKEVYNWYNANVGSSWNKSVWTDNYHWFGNEYNDDVMWQIIAVARLGLLSNSRSYINAAKRNFDIIYERAYIPFTGLMRWAEGTNHEAYGTNSCIAGPTEVAACYLGFAGCGEEYFDKARDLYAAQRYTLANHMSTGKVWDSVVWDPETKRVKDKNEWGSTYNQGTMLGAACMLYKYYGDEQYLKDAEKIMQWTKENLCNNHGIINVCQGGENHDLWGFKGILMRYVRRFIRDLGETDYQAWMEKNALHAYCNRTTEGITPTAWLQKGNAENTSDDFGNSTAASAAVNVMFPDDPNLPYREKPLNDGISNPVSKEMTSETPIEYYDLSGRRLPQMSRSGIYIMRQGQQTKIIHKAL